MPALVENVCSDSESCGRLVIGTCFVYLHALNTNKATLSSACTLLAEADHYKGISQPKRTLYARSTTQRGRLKMHWCSVMLLILSVLYTVHTSEAAENQLGAVLTVVSDIFNNVMAVVAAGKKEITGLFGLGPRVRALTPLEVVPA
ncbi:hypothetical protein MRX96_021573 [Rhipicephalus microplus]